TDAYLEKAFDIAEFQRRKTALELERRQLDDPSGADPEKCEPADMRFYLELAQRPSLLYKVALPDDKRDLVRILTSNRSVRARTPRFQLAIPFSDLSSSPKSHSGSPSCNTPRTRRRIRTLVDGWVEGLKPTSAKDAETRKDQLTRLRNLVARSS